MLQDSLRESWLYQKVLEDGRKEGRAEARAEGFAEGRVEGFAEGYEEGRVQVARETITLFTEKCFPAILAWVQERLEQTGDLQTLHEIEEALFKANTEEEIRQAFAPTHRESLEAPQ